jgi:hypothetical protein
MLPALFVEIVFVFDVADDLLQHVFNRHQSGDAAVFIDHDRDVIAVGAKVASSTFSRFDSGMNTGCAQHAAYVEGFVADPTQQILGQQNADHLSRSPSITG